MLLVHASKYLVVQPPEGPQFYGMLPRDYLTTCISSDNEELWTFDPAGSLSTNWRTVFVDLISVDGVASDYKVILKHSYPVDFSYPPEFFLKHPL